MTRKKWVCSAIIIATAVLMLVSILFNYVTIDLSAILDSSRGGIGDIIGSALGVVSGTKNVIAVSGISLIRNLMSGSIDLLSGNISSFLTAVAWVIMMPYFMAMAEIVFILIRKRWSYISTLILSLGGLVSSVYGIFCFIPSSLVSWIPGEIRISGIEQEARTVIWNNIGIAWWTVVIGSVIVLILSVYGIIVSSPEGSDNILYKYESNAENGRESISSLQKKRSCSRDSDPGIICSFGDLAGVKIPIESEEELVIGSDPGSCNLIIRSPWIGKAHCMVIWDDKKNDYLVSNYSKDGIYVNRHILSKGSSMRANSGDVIILSKANERITLA